MPLALGKYSLSATHTQRRDDKNKHLSCCHESSLVPAISSKWLPEDKRLLLGVPLDGHILLGDRAGLAKDEGIEGTCLGDTGLG